MAPPTHEMALIDDPALEGGDWLFRRAGQVFGPVDSRALAAMLYRGELDPATPVSTGDGAWRAVGEVPLFLVHAKKAAAALRVEREVTGARLLRERRTRRHTAALVVAAVLIVAGGIGAGFLLAPKGAQTSALTEDFGAGISVVSRARVAVSRRADDEIEIEVPLDPRGAPAPAAPARRDRPGRSVGSVPSGAIAGGDLVTEQFDARKIQAVVDREQRSLAPCLRAEAIRSPEYRGDVPIEFAIGNDGRVVTLWIDEPRLREGALKTCLLQTLAAWRFESFPGARPTVQLTFRIGK
jgi:uncharacterized protein DUF4339